MGILDKLMGQARKGNGLLNEAPAAERQFDVEMLSTDIKNGLVLGDVSQRYHSRSW